MSVAERSIKNPAVDLPDDIELCRQLVDDLIADIQQIEAQLGAEMRLDPATGELMAYQDFVLWKQRAKKARAHKVTQLRELKRRLREARRESEVQVRDELVDAAIRYVREDSEEHFDLLEQSVERFLQFERPA